MAYFSRPEELLVAFEDLLQANKGLLGFRYVAVQDENLLPEYPAVEIAMGPTFRQDHGTQRFLLTFQAIFWIYHANYEATHSKRTIEDMQLATKVVQFLHLPENRALYDDRDAENKIVGGSGRVVQEIPGATVRPTGARVITTRLVWEGQSQVNYADS